MSVVTLWLSVHRDNESTGGWMGGGGDLFTRRFPTDFQPRMGDDITLWGTDEDGPLGGPSWPVKRVYWDADGGYHAELVPMQVRPTQRIAESIRARSPGELPYRKPWWDKEEPESLLLATGDWVARNGAPTT